MTGRVLGHYQVLEKLGEGGMGEVYRAADTKLGRDIALKVLPPPVAQDPERLERFQREARALAALDRPTIYHWYQADTAGDIQMLPGLVLSGTNHEGSGPRRADASRSMSAYGAIDMAGNVREWSASASDGSTRIALGGAWSDPAYQYLFADVRSPFDRSAGNGLRCMKRLEKDPSTAVDAPLARTEDTRSGRRAAGLGRRVPRSSRASSRSGRWRSSRASSPPTNRLRTGSNSGSRSRPDTETSA